MISRRSTEAIRPGTATFVSRVRKARGQWVFTVLSSGGEFDLSYKDKASAMQSRKTLLASENALDVSSLRLLSAIRSLMRGSREDQS